MSARSTQDTPLWNTMRRSDFDASEPLTLFDVNRDATAPVKADKYGTADMFADAADAYDSNGVRDPEAVVRREFACGCIHVFTGPLGSLSDRTPCSRHDSSAVPAAASAPCDAPCDDWEAAFLATYPSVSAAWPL